MGRLDITLLRWIPKYFGQELHICQLQAQTLESSSSSSTSGEWAHLPIPNPF